MERLNSSPKGTKVEPLLSSFVVARMDPFFSRIVWSAIVIIEEKIEEAVHCFRNI